MKRLLLHIDFHIIVLGLIVSVLFVGIVSMITFAPGAPSVLAVIAYCSLPALVLLEPAIITGTIDRRKHRADAVRYFIVNSLIALTFGVVSGLIIFELLPRKDAQETKRAEQVGAVQPTAAVDLKSQ